MACHLSVTKSYCDIITSYSSTCIACSDAFNPVVYSFSYQSEFPSFKGYDFTFTQTILNNQCLELSLNLYKFTTHNGC